VGSGSEMSDLPPGFVLVPPPVVAPGPVSNLPAGFVLVDPKASVPKTGVEQLADIDPEMQRVAFGDVLNTPLGGFVRGLRDPVDAGAQLLTRGLEAIAPEGPIRDWATGQRENVEGINKLAETDYTQNWRQGAPPSVDVGRLAGNIVGTAPVVAAIPGAGAATMLPRIASGAVGGGLASTLSTPVAAPTSAEDFWKSKGTDAGVGAVLGGASAPLIGGIARMVNPKVDPGVKALMDIGVRPTPGQILGGSAGRIEEGMQSIPLLGDFIKSGRGGAINQFNRGVIDNEVLAPIGGKLPRDMPLGRDAIAEAGDQVKAAYNSLLPKLTVQADQKFGADIAQLRGMAQYMPAENAQQFEKILQRELLDKIAPGGGMTGVGFKEAESTLGRLAADYRNSAIASERQLGGAFQQMQATLRDLLTRSNPNHATELGAINTAYANLLRVQGAAGRIGSEEGVFSPAQLLSSVRQLDPSLRHGAFARGEAKMQEIAEAGKTVLGNKVPDSGTPFRNLVSILAGALGGGAIGSGAVSPGMAAGLLGGGAATGAAYSDAGRAALAHLLASRPDMAPAIAARLRQSAPIGAAAAGGAGAALTP